MLKKKHTHPHSHKNLMYPVCFLRSLKLCLCQHHTASHWCLRETSYQQPIFCVREPDEGWVHLDDQSHFCCFACSAQLPHPLFPFTHLLHLFHRKFHLPLPLKQSSHLISLLLSVPHPSSATLVNQQRKSTAPWRCHPPLWWSGMKIQFQRTALYRRFSDFPLLVGKSHWNLLMSLWIVFWSGVWTGWRSGASSLSAMHCLNWEGSATLISL